MPDEQSDFATTESSQSSKTSENIDPFPADRLKYEDPWQNDPSRKGMLLSNQIEWFCQRQTLIAEGYSKTRVRPASYTLTIGADYVDSAGHRKRLSKDDTSYFYMEPNSIVYVSTAESLNLPYYIAARFNLRVKWVYRGILLGTGPQVEPGFRGNLSCPLFNLTDRPVKISLSDEFATIDFERTTDFAPDPEALGPILNWMEIRDSVKTLEKLDQVKLGDDTFLLFKQQSFPPLKHLPDHDVVSSLVQLSDEVKRWRAIGVGIVIAFVSLALTLLNFQANLYREQKTTSQQVFQLQSDLDAAREKLSALEENKSVVSPQSVPSNGTNASVPRPTKK